MDEVKDEFSKIVKTEGNTDMMKNKKEYTIVDINANTNKDNIIDIHVNTKKRIRYVDVTVNKYNIVCPNEYKSFL